MGRREKNRPVSEAKRRSRANGLVVSEGSRRSGKDWVVNILRDVLNGPANPQEIHAVASAMGAGLRYNLIQNACTNLDQQGHCYSLPDYGEGEGGCDSARLILAAEHILDVPDPKVYRREIKPAPYPIEVKQAVRHHHRSGQGADHAVETSERRREAIAAAIEATKKRYDK